MPEPQPATVGSYGEPPRGFRLPAGTALGGVGLQVADLGRSILFYERTLGFRTISRGTAHAVLAAQGSDAPLIELHAREGARPMAPHGRLGLFHFAILLPDRASLGRFVGHLSAIGVRAGAGDHLVSEAFYLSDPDGLGIEVYADRPRESWRRNGRELMMATDPVDIGGLIEAAGDEPWNGMPAGTVIGHVHLHVGDLARAAEFFSEALGFDRTVWTYPGALFFGADGYHHHLGANVWAGSGALPPEAHDARLLEWTIDLSDAESVAAAAKSLADAGFPVERVAGATEFDEFVTHDPWETSIRVRSLPAPQPHSAAAPTTWPSSSPSP